ncbi:MAG: M23 family metallopeptidase [Nostocales cyanobacterium]|nr:MAG: M23 family metallopeptidase [Nostocales cyanobacterium]TAF13068.1 MAG: M23 family metallopeptidase [Nostocales cyanobacterium]
MTQPKKSAHSRPSKRTQGLTTRRFASTLPAQSLGWLSSVSLLSGGFVFAQTESTVEITTPPAENAQPQTAATETKSDFSERRAKLKQKLKQQKESVSQTPESAPKSQPKAKNDQPVVIITNSKPQVEKSQIEKSPTKKAETPTQSQPAVSKKATQSVKKVENTASTTSKKAQDYNNSYIDPTEYNSPGTAKYEAPSSVVVTDRATGCEAVFSKREIAAGACSQKTPKTPAVADAPQKSAPSWIKKSETASLKTVPTNTRVAATSTTKTSTTTLTTTTSTATPIANNNVVSAVAAAVNSNQTWRDAAPARVSGGSTKSAYRRNRFIPEPSEFASTTVNTTPVAPSFGMLPAPVAEGNLEPRPSNVSYDFALASVLPQVPYNQTLAYGSGSGVMFPLSFAAPVTSLFGWRIHPITGDRRFHAGTDIGAPTGTPILAAAKGQVEIADWVGGYGLTVTINHSSAQQTLYGHMSEILVRPGQWVEPGMVIGRVGSTGNSTGPHLHFEVRHLTANGWVAVDPGVKLQAGLNNLLYSNRTVNSYQ